MAAYTVNTYRVLNRIGINQNIGTVSTTALHTLGDRVRAVDVSGTRGFAEFIYLAGLDATVAGTAVLIKDDWTTSILTADDQGAVALATAATVTGTYGWYQIKGVGVASSDTVAKAAACYIDGTAGRVDDAAVVGDQVIGMRTASTDDTNTCLVLMGCNPAVAQFNAA